METNRKKGLLICAIILQVVALVVTIVMTITQSSVKELYYGDSSLIQTNVIPYGTLIRIVTILVIYAIAFVMLMAISNSSIKVMAAVCIGVTCVVNAVVTFLSKYVLSVQSVYVHQDERLNYSLLENSVGMFSDPITLVALGLFCAGCGRLLEKKDTVNNN